MTLQERLQATDQKIATWRQRAEQAQEQLIAHQGQRALLVELLAEQDAASVEPRRLREAAK